MRLYIRKLLLLGIPALTLCVYFVVGRNSFLFSHKDSRNEERDVMDDFLLDHRYLMKQLDNVPFESDILKLEEFNETEPGFLVCDKRKKPIARVLSEENENLINIPGLAGMFGKAKDVNAIKAVAKASTKSGCCPPGDKNGILFHNGSACCLDKVYDVSTHFCCMLKFEVLTLSQEDLQYCFPDDLVPYCREKDLQIQTKKPMTVSCRRTRKKTPYFCRFKCPVGSQPMDIQTATCLKNGVWDQKPICCEGCPSRTKLDLWFVVEMSQKFGKIKLKKLLRFLKSLTSYLPVSQKEVRVGITIFNAAVFFDVGVWDMAAHDSYESLSGAIDELPFEGSGSSTGAALSWVANNAFSSEFGEREGVPNQVVAILHGTPNDSIFEGARELQTISKILAIAIGNGLSDEDLLAIGSNQDYVHRVARFSDLSSLDTVLYRSVCGENCIINKN